MDNYEFFKDYQDFAVFQPDRCGKSTLFENEYALVGLNCLEPGQSMQKHAHQVQTRFYVVLEGSGQAWVGEEARDAGAGMVIWVPSGKTHRIINNGDQRMVMLVGICPAHAE